MARFAQGKYSLAISDISGQAFPWNEMVTQWNGLFVHFSEFESKQPQLDPKPSHADPTASLAGDRIQFYYMSRIDDAGSYTNAADVPYFYIPCMCAGLAYYLSLKYSPERTQNLKMIYEDELLRAEAADGSSNSTFITPKSYYPGT